MKKFDIELCCEKCKARVKAQEKALRPLNITKWVFFALFLIFLLPSIKHLTIQNFVPYWWINWIAVAVFLIAFFLTQKKIKSLYPTVYGIYSCKTCNTIWNLEPPINKN